MSKDQKENSSQAQSDGKPQNYLEMDDASKIHF